jgi:hypothetical protein
LFFFDFLLPAYLPVSLVETVWVMVLTFHFTAYAA